MAKRKQIGLDDTCRGDADEWSHLHQPFVPELEMLLTSSRQGQSPPVVPVGASECDMGLLSVVPATDVHRLHRISHDRPSSPYLAGRIDQQLQFPALLLLRHKGARVVARETTVADQRQVLHREVPRRLIHFPQQFIL